ncbi:hypothetical protein K469DRAFT_760358, partial [Zopfia rhizophila CBS 207.26]
TKHLTRDERLQVQTLHLAGHSIQSIAALLNFTQRQVQYAAASQRVTPKKRSGRPQTLTSAQIDEIEVFVCSSRTGRLLSYTQLARGRHRKQWVTRRPGEELVDTCVLEKIRRRRGWMFWGCFSGTEKGPCLFWEKDWGSINKQSYCEKIVPLIHGWLRLRPGLQLMQDGAAGASRERCRDYFLASLLTRSQPN